MKQNENSPLLYVTIAGGVGGTLADVLLHSIDTLKTRMQVSHKYTSIPASFRLILREEGVRGLYGGFTASVLGSFTSTLAYFGSYEAIKRNLISQGVDPTLSFFVSGGMADVFAAIFYVPSEVLKTRVFIPNQVAAAGKAQQSV